MGATLVGGNLCKLITPNAPKSEPSAAAGRAHPGPGGTPHRPAVLALRALYRFPYVVIQAGAPGSHLTLGRQRPHLGPRPTRFHRSGGLKGSVPSEGQRVSGSRPLLGDLGQAPAHFLRSILGEQPSAQPRGEGKNDAVRIANHADRTGRCTAAPPAGLRRRTPPAPGAGASSAAAHSSFTTTLLHGSGVRVPTSLPR